MDPWEKVFINVGSKTLEQLDSHLATACTDCHGGDSAETEDMEKAHQGVVVDPSEGPDNICSTCHPTQAAGHALSLHLNLWGEKKAVAGRFGVESFGDCPAAAKDGFKAECASCHASCGQCHVSRPTSAGRGLNKGHVFNKTPHQKNQCMGCHGSRVEHDFLGVDENNKPDIHFAKGIACVDCHSGVEMHAAADAATDRYHAPEAPTCVTCHAAVQGANTYHAMHWSTLSCQVCHSQPYNNCTACHTGAAWKTDPAYAANSPSVDFRIGLNPIPDRPVKYATVRHVPVAPDTYDNWGVGDAVVAYDSAPTWKFATPHSIRLWTERTQVAAGASCGANCHIGAPGGSPANTYLYLTKDYVETNWPLEASANATVVVDDKLPAGWK